MGIDKEGDIREVDERTTWLELEASHGRCRGRLGCPRAKAFSLLKGTLVSSVDSQVQVLLALVQRAQVGRTESHFVGLAEKF